MYETLVDLSEQSKQSSAMVASLTNAIQFNTEKVNECKKKESRTWIQKDHFRKKNRDLKGWLCL